MNIVGWRRNILIQTIVVQSMHLEAGTYGLIMRSRGDALLTAGKRCLRGLRSDDGL